MNESKAIDIGSAAAAKIDSFYFDTDSDPLSKIVKLVFVQVGQKITTLT